MLTPGVEPPTTRVQMDMSEILSHCWLHGSDTLIEEHSTYTVAEYLDLMEVEEGELSSLQLDCSKVYQTLSC